jgi:uncharacterized phage protein gp47/JayE
MNYGITAKGFEPKTYQVLLNELYTRWEQSFGAIDTDPDGAFGQLAISTSYANAELWEVFQSMYLNNDLRSSTGSHLDRLVFLQGFTRQLPVRASSPVYFGGETGTVISEGDRVKQSTTGKTFALTSGITISNTSCVGVDIDLIDGTNPSVTFGTTVVTGTDLDSFKQNLLERSVTLGIRIDESITDTDVAIRSYDPFVRFSISINGSSVTIPNYYQLGFVVCTEDGINVIPMGSIDTRYDSAVGWNNCYNPVNGSSGKLEETDEQLRLRMRRLRNVSSSATQYAIEARIWENVKDVSEVKVFSNRKDIVDSFGRPPHSVQVVVEGGDDSLVAEQIYNTIPVGIETHGSISVAIADDVIKFDRTKTLFGWIKVVINKKNIEEDYPTNGESIIRNALYSYIIRTVELGVDLVAQKLIGVVYRAVLGLEDVTVTVAVTGTRDIDPNGSAVGTPTDYDILTYNSGFKNKVVVAPTDKVEWRDAFTPDRIIVIDEDV